MLRPWSTKRVPWSKPAEYIVTRPTPPSSSTATSERAVEAGEHRPHAAARATGVSKTALIGRSRGARRADRSGARAAPTPAPDAGARGRRRRRVLRRAAAPPSTGRGLPIGAVDWPCCVARDVVLARVLARQHVVEHAARDRRRGAGAEAGVLDDHRERDLRRPRAARTRCTARGRGGARRSCAALYFSFGLDRRSTCAVPVLPPVLYGAPANDARRGAFLRHAVAARLWITATCSGFQPQRRQRLRSSRRAARACRRSRSRAPGAA